VENYRGFLNAGDKDRLANYLHDAVCSGRMPLQAAQEAIAADWGLLPRIHHPRDGSPQTYSTLQYAKTRIRSAHRFLAWLGQRNTCLGGERSGRRNIRRSALLGGCWPSA
jgi:hypothetical protein